MAEGDASTQTREGGDTWRMTWQAHILKAGRGPSQLLLPPWSLRGMLFAAARRRESQSQSEFHALESDLAVASDKSISSRIRDARPKGKLLAQLHDPKLTDRVRCEIAALYMQRAFRGHRVRKEYAHNRHKINLRYEIKILQERSQRRGLFVGFLQHLGCQELALTS